MQYLYPENIILAFNSATKMSDYRNNYIPLHSYRLAPMLAKQQFHETVIAYVHVIVFFCVFVCVIIVGALAH